MSDRHERMARIYGINLETGQFTMTLATEGEASDGDILSIKGGKVPKRMPMLNGHYNSATEQLGSITDPEKLLDDSPPRLRATGHIELGGDTGPADVRRDLAYMISQGHVTGMSIRWDTADGGKAPVRRINLPSDHPYFVDAENEKDHRKRWGYFWPEWKALEGSIVALGSDSKALIGRADEIAEERPESARFLRAMAEDAEAGGDNRANLPAAFVERLEADLPADESPEAKIAASLAGLRIDAADCIEAGASHADMLNAVADGSDEDFQAVEFDDRLIFLPAPVADQLRARLEPEVVADLEVPAPDQAPAPEARADQPSPLTLDAADIEDPIDAELLAKAFTAELDAADERFGRLVKKLIETAQGKVD